MAGQCVWPPLTRIRSGLRAYKPGVARQPLPFLCFVKEKEAKERRPQDLPCGCLRFAAAHYAPRKNGKCPKLASLRQRTFLIHFPEAHSAVSQADKFKTVAERILSAGCNVKNSKCE